MRTLPAELILEKNKSETGSAWLFFIEIILPDITLYLVRNNEDITFQGQLYTAFPFDIEPIISSSKGEIPSLVIKVSNVTRVIQAYIEQYNGAVGEEVVLNIVNSDNLASDYSDFEMVFTIQKTEADESYVSITLGPSNPMARRFPLYRYIAEHCNWRFRSEECSFSGTVTLTTCGRSYNDCRARNNSENFGGHKGLASGGIRFV